MSNSEMDDDPCVVHTNTALAPKKPDVPLFEQPLQVVGERDRRAPSVFRPENNRRGLSDKEKSAKEKGEGASTQ